MKIALIGAGQRGRVYANYIAEKHYAEIAAVVEPDAARRQAAARQLGVPEQNCFADVQGLWARGKIADAVIIASMDQDHYPQVMAALELGYHILLEKPISPDPAQCMEILRKAEETKRKVVVCHVLRYTPFFSQVKEIIRSGRIGKLVSVRLDENIGNFHFAHSFVRGNWRRAELASPSIMQKSCHDMDLLNWLVGARAKRIASYGALHYFKEENAPAGSTARCADCPAEPGCRFSAYKSYLPAAGGWPAAAVTPAADPAALRDTLRESPYGRCVYRCDNDVCDQQVVAVEYESGQTASFNMSAFTNRMNRTIHVMCEDGEIFGDDGLRTLEVVRFASNQVEGYRSEVIHVPEPPSGHGGGDTGIVDEFVALLQNEGQAARSAIGVSVDSHIMAAAAEQSRVTGRMIDLAEYRRQLGGPRPGKRLACAGCGAGLSNDEIAFGMHLHGGAAGPLLCLRCLTRDYGCEAAVLEKKIEALKQSGCKYFAEAYV